MRDCVMLGLSLVRLVPRKHLVLLPWSFAIALLLSWQTGSCLLAQAPAGSVAGLVTDESGKPVAGAFVILVRTGLPPASGQAASSASGAFLIGGLPAGAYSVCAQVRGGGFLDDCLWSPAPPTVAVNAAQQVAGLQVRLKKGAIVPVRLNDTARLLAATSGPRTAPREVLMMVKTTRGLLHPATLVSKDANGSNHQITIPFDTVTKLNVFGAGVSLADGAGKSIAAAGTDLTISQSRAAPASAPLTLNVTGLKP